MATTWYLRSAVDSTGYTEKSTDTATRQASDSGTLRRLSPTIGTLVVDPPTVQPGAAAEYNFHRAFVTPELITQTISAGQTWTAYIASYESSTSANQYLRIYCYVLRDGSNVATVFGPIEETVESSVAIYLGRILAGTNVGDIELLDGDQIVLELWSHGTATMSTYNTKYPYEGTTEIANETSTYVSPASKFVTPNLVELATKFSPLFSASTQVNPVVLPSFIAAIAPAFFFVYQQLPTSEYISYTGKWQNQSIAEPIYQNPEVITIDKWFKQHPEPVRVPPRSQPVFSFHDPFISSWLVPFDSWYRPASEPIFLKPTPLYQNPNLPRVEPEVLTIDKWYQPASEPTRRIERCIEFSSYFYVYLPGPTSEYQQFTGRWQYQIIAEPFPSWAENITLDKWYPQCPDPVRLKPQIVRENVYTEQVTSREGTITLDKWYMPTSEPVRNIQRTTQFPSIVYIYIPLPTSDYQAYKGRYQYKDLVQPFKEIPTRGVPFDWYIQHPDPIRRKHQVIDSHRPCAAIEEESSIEKWWQPYPNPVIPIRRHQPEITFYQQWVPPADIGVNLDKWYQPASEPVRLIPTYGQYPEYFNQWLPLRDNPVQLDQWYQPASEPIFTKPPFQDQISTYWPSVDFPVITSDYQAYYGRWQSKDISYLWFARDQPVSLDKWYQQPSEPVRPKPVYIQQPSSYFLYTPAPIQSIDKWFNQTSIPVRPVLRLQPQITIFQCWPPPRDIFVPLDRWYSLPSQPLIIIPRSQAQITIFQQWIPPRDIPVDMSTWYQPEIQLVRVYPSLNHLTEMCYIYEIPVITRRSMPIFLLGLS